MLYSRKQAGAAGAGALTPRLRSSLFRMRGCAARNSRARPSAIAGQRRTRAAPASRGRRRWPRPVTAVACSLRPYRGAKPPETPRPPAGGRARAAGPVRLGHARHGLPARPGCLTAPESARRGSRHRPAALSEHGLPAAPNRRARGPYHGPRCPPGGLSRAAGLRPGWRRGKLPRLARARPASPHPPSKQSGGCGSRETP